jgi:hypothetical protein
MLKRVVDTSLDRVIYKGDNNDLDRMLSSYDFFAVFEVKNGDPRTHKDAPGQALSASDFVSERADGHVAPGIAYVRNQDAYREEMPKRIETLIHISQYEDRRLREALDGVLELDKLPGEERDYVGDVLTASNRNKIPLAPFFDLSHPKYGTRIVESLPWCRSRSDLAEKLSHTRGLLMELYVALLFDEQLTGGDVGVRVPYKITDDESGEVVKKDIDVLVATTADAFDEAVRKFPRRVNRRLSRELRKYLRNLREGQVHVF